MFLSDVLKDTGLQSIKAINIPNDKISASSPGNPSLG